MQGDPTPMSVTQSVGRPCEEEVVQFRVLFRDGPGEAEVGTRLPRLRDVARAVATDYLWHADEIEFEVEPEPAASVGACASGAVQFGESLEDEWLVARVLQAITAQVPGTAAQVWDADGEFLLIEAAAVLPDWVTPENSAHRVFLHSGRLLLVPPSVNPGRAEQEHGAQLRGDWSELDVFPLTLNEGLHAVWSQADACLAPAAVRSAVAARLEDDARRAVVSRHVAHCVVPLRAARVLARDPRLAAPAVRTVCQRDAVEMRRCARMPTFPPNPSVRTPVRYTRCLFAMQDGSSLHPPKPFRPFPAHDPRHEDHAAFLRGVKLACGLEIMAQALQRRRQRQWGNPRDGKGALSSHLQRLADALEATAAPLEGGEEAAAARFAVQCAARPESDDAWLRVSEEDVAARLARSAVATAAEPGVSGVSGDGGAEDKEGPALQAALQESADAVKRVRGFVEVGESDVGGVAPSEEEAAVSAWFAEADAAFQSAVAVDAGEGGSAAREGSPCASPPATPAPEAPTSWAASEQRTATAVLPDGPPPGTGADGRGGSSTDSDSDDVADSDDECGASEPAEDAFDVSDAMTAMDAQLRGTTLAQSFARQQNGAVEGEEAGHAGDGDLPPVDLDLNLVRNLLQSVDAQGPEAGPGTTLMAQLGASLPAVSTGGAATNAR